MCGIAGLLILDEDLQGDLGRMLVPMVECLASRGPDSTGYAFYSAPLDGKHRIVLRLTEGGGDASWPALLEALAAKVGAPVSALGAIVHDRLCTLVTGIERSSLLQACSVLGADVEVQGFGRSVDVLKDVGDATTVARRYGISRRAGYQGIGHTRMATESAVTTRHSHPFCPAADLCLAHNGSFANHATIRRRLVADGVVFDSDNDSEVAARYLAWHLADGRTLKEALGLLAEDFDGFYTLLVTTASEFCVMRDPFACKPMTVAETPGYVAVASEYQALSGLPGIESARVFEPRPETVYGWSR